MNSTNLSKKEYLSKIAPEFSVFDLVEKAYYTDSIPNKFFNSLFYIKDVKRGMTYDTKLRRAMFLIHETDNIPFTTSGKYITDEAGNILSTIIEPNLNVPSLYDMVKNYSSYNYGVRGQERYDFITFKVRSNNNDYIYSAKLNEDYFIYKYKGELVVICDATNRINADLDEQPTIQINTLFSTLTSPSGANISSQIIGVGF